MALYNRGKELYFSIHGGIAASFIALALNRLGALLRLTAWIAATVLTLGAHSHFRRQASLFARVLASPLHGPPLRD